MKNVLNQKNWNQVAVQMHVEPLLVPLIKSNNDRNLDRDCVKIKLLRVTTAESSYLYEFKLTFLTAESRRSSCCSYVTFKLLSRRQEFLLLE